MFTKRTLASLPLLFILALGACEQSPSGIDPSLAAMQKVAGSYVASSAYGATRFNTIIEGQTTNWLAKGAVLQINLSADGTTTGRLLVPGMDEGGGDFDKDLAGRWSLKGDTVHFEQSADTFVRDMPFLVRGNTLQGDGDFGNGNRIQVTFTKQ
jgi:hypothetical protein